MVHPHLVWAEALEGFLLCRRLRPHCDSRKMIIASTLGWLTRKLLRSVIATWLPQLLPVHDVNLKQIFSQAFKIYDILFVAWETWGYIL